MLTPAPNVIRKTSATKKRKTKNKIPMRVKLELVVFTVGE